MDLTHRPVKLCILSKWSPHFEGYGFDLMTKKSGEGHYISMVHEGGPAEATHLESGDWLIEVNNVNVERLTHSEVIKLIKESPNGSVVLLLAPSETDKWRKRNQISITSSHPDLVHYITPPYQGKLRSFINGALDRLVIGSKRTDQSIDSEPSVYHRYSLPIPSGMAVENGIDWSPTGGKSALHLNQTGSMGNNGEGQLAGSLDEQRQKEIADWRDKSFEMLMANQVDEDEDDINDSNIINQVENEISILSPVDHHQHQHHHVTHNVNNGNNNNQSRPVSSNQEKVLADIHLTDINSQQDNNSAIITNNHNNHNGVYQEDNNNRHVTCITLLDGEFFARQCKIKKSSETADYGFNMDSLPSGGGHFLRSIEPTGPAGISGICQDDRLIEVNNVNVEYTDHDTVVNMIRKSPDCEVTLLVVDEKSYKWFKSRNIRIHHGAGGSLVRYCDHRGLRESGYTLERPTSRNDDNRKGQFYRRGISSQSTIVNDEQSTGTSDEVQLEDEAGNSVSVKLRNGKESNHDVKSITLDTKSARESASSTPNITSTTPRSSKTNQLESPSSLSDWSIGSFSDGDRLNRGKTIIEVPDDAPRPRLCSITKDPDGIFGFTLNTYEKGRVKLIADIDKASPAEAAGLLQWDRVIEVNGVNINIENHAQVTGRIEASGNRLHLLVLPEAQYEWYDRAGLVPKSNQSNVIYLSNTDVTRDSVVIAQSLANSMTNVSLSSSSKKASGRDGKSSSSMSKKTQSLLSTTASTSASSSSMTTSTVTSSASNSKPNKSPSSIITDNGTNDDRQATMEMIKTRKEDDQMAQFNQSTAVNSDDNQPENSVIQARETSSTIVSHNTIEYSTIDEETSEAIYDHRETSDTVSTLPMRKPKKTSFTKRIFKRSLFSSINKKDKLYSKGGSLSNLSVKSEIITGTQSNPSQVDYRNATLKRSVTLTENQVDQEDEEIELPQEAGVDDVNQVRLTVKKDIIQEKSLVWSTSTSNNNNNTYSPNNNNDYHGLPNNINSNVKDDSRPREGGQVEDAESQLLTKLKTLSLHEIKQKSRSENKIQAYHRMSKLNFSQRIAHFEEL